MKKEKSEYSSLVWGLIIIIITLIGFIVYLIFLDDDSNKKNNINNNSSSTTLKSDYTEDIKATYKSSTVNLIGSDNKGYTYYLTDYSDIYSIGDTYKWVATIISVKNGVINQLYDFSINSSTSWLDAPYSNYLIKDGFVYFIFSGCTDDPYDAGSEIKVTLDDGKYVLSTTGVKYVQREGLQC